MLKGCKKAVLIIQQGSECYYYYFGGEKATLSLTRCADRSVSPATVSARGWANRNCLSGVGPIGARLYIKPNAPCIHLLPNTPLHTPVISNDLRHRYILNKICTIKYNLYEVRPVRRARIELTHVQDTSVL